MNTSHRWIELSSYVAICAHCDRMRVEPLDRHSSFQPWTWSFFREVGSPNSIRTRAGACPYKLKENMKQGDMFDEFGGPFKIFGTINGQDQYGSVD